MGRFRELHDDGGETGIDISPLIDCVFILLIFFIVTTVFVEETGVEVDRPQAANSSQLEKTSILIAITEEGQVVHAKENIGVGRVQSTVRAQVQQEQVPVIIQADKKAPAGLLVEVMDQAYLGGAKTVNIASLRKGG